MRQDFKGGQRFAFQHFQKCAAAGALGVVAIVSGPTGEVVAINTPVTMKLGIPVLQVGDKERKRFDAALAATQTGKLIIEGPGGVRTGRNTIARSGSAGPWVMISTPQSGWFTCGGERGPGIAMLPMGPKAGVMLLPFGTFGDGAASIKSKDMMVGMQAGAMGYKVAEVLAANAGKA